LNLCFETLVSLPFDENTYVVFLRSQSECIVVDPGLEPDIVIQYVERRHLTPVAILNTHGHSDHIAGNEALKQFAPNAPLIIGHGDADKLTDPVKNLSAPFGLRLVSPPADQLVRHGDTIHFAGMTWTVRETPGHSQGHVVFLCRDNTPWVVLGGDVLFQGSIGRSDFPDGDHDQLLSSIRTQLYDLPDDTLVLPGHGPVTTIGEEKAHNPFVRGS
jgi:hydroxyacylglutathione hydrolase